MNDIIRARKSFHHVNFFWDKLWATVDQKLKVNLIIRTESALKQMNKCDLSGNGA